MTRIAIDDGVALRIVREGLTPTAALVGPVVLRSHVLSMLYREVRAGALTEKEGRRLLEGLASLKIRLLGDRVSRATAFTLAARLDWDDTARAEYLAVAKLQADVLVADDPVLRSAAAGIIDLAHFAAISA